MRKYIIHIGIVIASCTLFLGGNCESSTQPGGAGSDGGGSDGDTRDVSNSDGGKPDAPGTTFPEKSGTVSLGIGLGSTVASAGFATTTASPFTCTTTTLLDANCNWVHCTGDLAGSPTRTVDSAGPITITGGTKTLTLTPDATNAYPPVFSNTPAWSAGQMITFTAAGATVPAFTGTLSAPMPLTLTSPSNDAGTFTINRALPFALTWTGGAVGKFFIAINGPEGPTMTAIDNISCTFDAASGSGSVSSETLMKMPAGSNAVLVLDVLDQKIVKAGDYAVAIQTYAGVANKISNIPITLQ